MALAARLFVPASPETLQRSFFCRIRQKGALPNIPHWAHTHATLRALIRGRTLSHPQTVAVIPPRLKRPRQPWRAGWVRACKHDRRRRGERGKLRESLSAADILLLAVTSLSPAAL